MNPGNRVDRGRGVCSPFQLPFASQRFPPVCRLRHDTAEVVVDGYMSRRLRTLRAAVMAQGLALVSFVHSACMHVAGLHTAIENNTSTDGRHCGFTCSLQWSQRQRLFSSRPRVEEQRLFRRTIASQDTLLPCEKHRLLCHACATVLQCGLHCMNLLIEQADDRSTNLPISRGLRALPAPASEGLMARALG
jgi:hypothetical protein